MIAYCSLARRSMSAVHCAVCWPFATLPYIKNDALQNFNVSWKAIQVCSISELIANKTGVQSTGFMQSHLADYN